MFIWIVVVGWLYVALMMALAEGMHPGGSWLGAFFTFMLYGVGPVALVSYLLGTPLRRQRQRLEQPPPAGAQASPAMAADASSATEAAASSAPGRSAAVVAQPDARGHAAGDAVAPEREES